jgi:hypothetical protein
MVAMQPTELQVQRSLQALNADDHGGHGQPAPPDHGDDIPAGLVDVLARVAPVRPERVDAARRSLDTGEGPSAEALASRMVGRLVCDRLR